MGRLDRILRRAPEPASGAGKGTSDMQNIRPPKGASGRGHTAGFLDLEEFNWELKHPNGQKVFDKMYRTDGDCRQSVQLVVNPITAGTWDVTPYGGQEAVEADIEIAECVRWALWEQMSPNILGHLIEFLPVLVRAGFAPGEITWKGVPYKNGEMRLVPRSIALRLPRTIAQWEQDVYGELTRIKQYLPTPQRAITAREGKVGTGGAGTDESEIWMDRKDLVYYRIGGEGDNWEGVSLLRPAYKHWLLKDRIERIDAIAQEREALGVPICYPPMGATPEQLDEMEDILASMRTNEEGYIIAPGPKAGSGLSTENTGWLIEVIGYDRTGSGRDPQPSLAYHTQKIAAAFIAEFMRLGHGQTGARATAQVQADPFLMSIEALVTIVEQQLNHDIVVPFVKANFPNITNFPRLSMSLVDSTSLAQLADFVQKLTQIGALMPDQELEDFLRARADLPPSNPESVKKREKEDDQLRRDIVMGGAQDAFGANDKPGKEHGTKDAAGTKKAGSTGGGDRGKKDGTLDAVEGEYVTLSHYDAVSDRYRPRARRYDELWVDLDYIEDTMDSAPSILSSTCAKHVIAGTDMTSDLYSCLDALYTHGYQSVLDEANAQRPDMDTTMLSAGARTDGGRLQKRAEAIARKVKADMDDTYFGMESAHGNEARAKIAAEKAGIKSLERAGYDHGVAAILHGRHDAGTFLASDDSPFTVLKVRYSAVLDRSTCEECRAADDGQARDLDDPVRLHRMPPNPDCLSTHSGHNRCRCFETYEVEPMEFSQTLDDSELPTFVNAVVTRLVGSGYADRTRAVAVARQIARSYCRTGKLMWPGLRDVGSRVDACEAV